jgi:hypothetical protein
MNEFKDKGWRAQVVKYLINEKYNGKNGALTGVCLSSFFSYLRDTINPFSLYEFSIPKGTIPLSIGYSDWCPFNLEEIIRTLEDIKLIVDFEYKVSETENYFRIILKISNKGLSKERNNHFYLLTRVRYLYQYPYCVLYKDAMRLSKIPEFSDWSLQDLYSLCIETNPDKYKFSDNKEAYWYDAYHSVQLHPQQNFLEKKSKEQIKAILEVPEFYMEQLNSIYKVQTDKISIKLPNNDLLYSLAYWRDEFNTRIPYYLANKKGYTTKNAENEKPKSIDYLEILNRVRNTKIDLGDRNKNGELISQEFKRMQNSPIEF